MWLPTRNPPTAGRLVLKAGGFDIRATPEAYGLTHRQWGVALDLFADVGNSAIPLKN